MFDFNHGSHVYDNVGAVGAKSDDDNDVAIGKHDGNSLKCLKFADGDDFDVERSNGDAGKSLSLEADGDRASSKKNSATADNENKKKSWRQSPLAISPSHTSNVRKHRPLSDFGLDENSMDDEIETGDENLPARSAVNNPNSRRSSNSIQRIDRDGKKSVASKYFQHTSRTDRKWNNGHDLQSSRFPNDGPLTSNQTMGDVRRVYVEQATEAGNMHNGARDGRRDYQDVDSWEEKENSKNDEGKARSESREWDAFASLEKNLQSCDDSDSCSSREGVDDNDCDSVDDDKGHHSFYGNDGDKNILSGDNDLRRGRGRGSRQLEGHGGLGQHLINGVDKTMKNEEPKWDAFKSFQENYESSDDSDTASDEDDEYDGCSYEDYCSDESLDEKSAGYHEGSNVYDLCDVCEDDSCNQDSKMQASGLSPPMERPKSDVECIDLADTDDDGGHCRIDDLVTTSDKMKAQHHREQTKGRRSKVKSHSSLGFEPPKVTKTRTSLRRNNHGAESDSSLSEIEDAQHRFSPGRLRPLPPWQRSTRETSSIAESAVAATLAISTSLPQRQPRSKLNNRQNVTKPMQSFPCMNQRNDVVCGSGAGINGFTMYNRNSDEVSNDEDLALGSGRKKSGGSTSNRKGRVEKSASAKDVTADAGRKKTKTGTKSSATSSDSRKRKSSTTPASSNTKSLSAPKKRRRRSYNPKSRFRRSAGRRSTGSRELNDPWTARERGIRDQHCRGKTSRGGRTSNGSGAYMDIVKQEPMLRGIGGASIQF